MEDVRNSLFRIIFTEFRRTGMKKILALALVIASVLPCVAVYAQNEIKATLIDNVLTVAYTEGEGDVATLTFYDNGKMCGAKSAHYSDGAYKFELTEGDIEKDIRIFFYTEKSYPLLIAMPAPEPTATPKPTKKPLPAAYEKPLDAVNAPAVVTDVARVSVDGEIGYELTMLYQGETVTTYVREQVMIVSAPSDMSQLTGNNVGYLQAGDIIHFVCDLQGRIRTVEFIYRPDFANYYEDGIPTNGIIGADGFSEFKFGAAINTYRASIEMVGADGNIYDLDVSPDAFVYRVYNGYNGAKCELDGTGPKLVPTAYVPDSNITATTVSWAGVDEIPYVLARVSRGTVTDIIIFE